MIESPQLAVQSEAGRFAEFYCAPVALQTMGDWIVAHTSRATARR